VAHTATESVCADCGLVTDADPIDYSPDWGYADDPEENPERARPGNRAHGDRGLGSVRDGGATRDARRQDALNRRAKERKVDRNRRYATTEIHRMTTALELPRYLGDRGKRLFRAVHADGLNGRDLDTVAAAALLCACREAQAGRVAGEIAAVARADERPIQRRLRWVASETGTVLPPPDVAVRIRVVHGRLPEADSTARERAVDRLGDLDAQRVASASPSVVAACLLYDVGPWTQTTVAEAAGVTPTAMRQRRDKLQT
jgi:transcription initiation factor TFIIB